MRDVQFVQFCMADKTCRATGGADFGVGVDVGQAVPAEGWKQGIIIEGSGCDSKIIWNKT